MSFFGIVPSDSFPVTSLGISRRSPSFETKEAAVARVAAGRRGNPFQRDTSDRAVDDRPSVSV